MPNSYCIYSRMVYVCQKDEPQAHLHKSSLLKIQNTTNLEFGKIDH